MKALRILVGCEFSQVVCKAFRERGHEAFSCDLLPCEGGHPEWHIQDDIIHVMLYDHFDLGIFHPPCTYLTVSGNKWMKPEYAQRFPRRMIMRNSAELFFLALYNAPIHRVCVENPIGIMSTRFRKPDQVLQPWMFGHGETKATCLWLRNLPLLQPTHRKDDLFCEPEPKERVQRLHLLPPSKDRWKLRSITYQGLATAMADQWGDVL